eukprot:Nk52_evm53s1401 gene=Nk52_evmTU53s1401
MVAQTMDLQPNQDKDGSNVEKSIPKKSIPKKSEYAISNLYVLGLTFLLFSITDGAMQMIILFEANSLGFSAFEIALMFVLFEFLGMITNLFGGVMATKIGLRASVILGMVAQLGCLVMLLPFREKEYWEEYLHNSASIVIYIMFAQGLSGIAKDLVKLSGKSVVKLVLPEGDNKRLMKYAARVTGLKNEMKGVGFFVGSLLITFASFFTSLLVIGGIVLVLIPPCLFKVHTDIGKSKTSIDWAGVFKKGKNFNVLCGARFFLFGARDVWFQTVLPIFLKNVVGWSPILAGSVLGLWTIGYGLVQGWTNELFLKPLGVKQINGTHLRIAMIVLLVISASTSFSMNLLHLYTNVHIMAYTLLGFLVIYGVSFAVNSSVHSYLVVLYSSRDKVAQSVGFYYMSNAAGRMVGNLVGGLLYTTVTCFDIFH